MSIFSEFFLSIGIRPFYPRKRLFPQTRPSGGSKEGIRSLRGAHSPPSSSSITLIATTSSPSSTSSVINQSSASSPASSGDTATANTRVLRERLYPSDFACSSARPPTPFRLSSAHDGQGGSPHLTSISKERIWTSFESFKPNFAPIPSLTGTSSRRGPPHSQ